MPMKKVCLILGAGASVEFGAPGTEALTTLIEKRPEDDKWVQGNRAFATYQLIKGKLQEFLVKPGTLHFEHIYHCIHELLQFSYEVSAEAFDEFRYLLQPFLSLIEKNDLLPENKLRCLEQRYIQFIYEIISESCENSKCSIEPLSGFINTLIESNILRIYNLNYDGFCYQAAPSLYTGFGKQDGGRFLRESFFDMEERPSLFHLHGSVHMNFCTPPKVFDIGDLPWFEDKKEALKHSSSPSGRRQMDGGQVAMHPIVTGLDKLSRIQSIPFNYYYSMLPRDLFSSDLVILAGYGMSDLHINTWLTQARVSNPNQRLVIIDCMNENDPYFSSSRKSIEWVHSLRVKAAEPCAWKKGKNDGWFIVPDSKVAVWIKGFQSFLTDSSYCETLHELQ